MRGIMPIVHRFPPALTLTTGLLALAYGLLADAPALLVGGAICILLGAHDVWRARHPK